MPYSKGNVTLIRSQPDANVPLLLPLVDSYTARLSYVLPLEMTLRNVPLLPDGTVMPVVLTYPENVYVPLLNSCPVALSFSSPAPPFTSFATGRLMHLVPVFLAHASELCPLGAEVVVKLYEDDSLENVKKHAEKGFARASALGGKIAVIGSGAARSIPDGVDEDCAKKRFTEVLSVCADIAAKYGMKVVVEPLNSNETNFITTVGEGSEIARLSKRKNAGVLVDFYHFTRENESDDALIPVGDILYHVHVATPRACRGIPEEEDTPTMKKWAQMLKEINYEGYVSLECNHEADIAESYIKAKKMLEFFRL